MHELAIVATQWTARLSAVLFLAGFAAAPLAALWPARVTRALERSQQRWWRAVAVSHTLHLAAIAWRQQLEGWPVYRGPQAAAVLIGGATVYVTIYALAFGAQWARQWGVYYVWFAFTAAYAGGGLRPGLAMAVALVVALGLRIAARPARKLSRAKAGS